MSRLGGCLIWMCDPCLLPPLCPLLCGEDRWISCVDDTTPWGQGRGDEEGALQAGTLAALMTRWRLIARRVGDYPVPVKVRSLRLSRCLLFFADTVFSIR